MNLFDKIIGYSSIKKELKQISDTPKNREAYDRLGVSAPEHKDGKRYQKVEIHYNGVGIVREPTAEEMEKYFEEHIKNKLFLKEKTA